jgi:uncharacterized protein
MKDDLDRSSEDQDAVFRFLADPATHGGAAVKRINTHAASVFLAGPIAYKVKRAVRLPFLDFSTLDKRKAALKAEIAANRPFAPELYLEVLPIVRHDGALAIGGEGTGLSGRSKCVASMKHKLSIFSPTRAASTKR